MNKREWEESNLAFLDLLIRDIKRYFRGRDVCFTIQDIDLTKPLPEIRIIIKPEHIDGLNVMDVPYTLDNE